MPVSRPCVLTVAGFDPSGGAGVLADAKTFEAAGVYGLGVCSAITYQNDIAFDRVDWISIENIISQIEILSKRFPIEFVKIGLLENLQCLETLITYLKSKNEKVKIIWDPILKASAGFEFHPGINPEFVKKLISRIYLVTPNWVEAKRLLGSGDAVKSAEELSNYCAVYLKGGHSDNETAKDILFFNHEMNFFDGDRIVNGEKHGSGCVLSSAITAYLAKGKSLPDACTAAKNYISNFLSSTSTLLGTHYKNQMAKQ